MLLGGCSGGHTIAPVGTERPTAATQGPGTGDGAFPASPSSVTRIPSANAPTLTGSATPDSMTDACGAFHQFYDDLSARGPAAVHQLLFEAQAVQQAASDGAALGILPMPPSSMTPPHCWTTSTNPTSRQQAA